jgi:L-ascorbate metabolism protein UlaG (beta-lactamase superfamily)
MPGKIRFLLKLIAWLAVGFFSVVIILFAIGCFFFASPPYHGRITDHFDGTYFYNEPRAEKRHFGSFLKWMWTREPCVWRGWTDSPPGSPPPKQVGKRKLRITFINHATILIQMDGLNILSDPVWSYRIGPVSWAGPRRHRPPGIEFDDLPKIDVVIISHNHYDALDMPTIKKLVEKHQPKIFAGLGNQAFFKKLGIEAQDMDWWDSVELKNKIKLTFVPSKHFSGRGMCDRNRTLWGGFVIEGKGGDVYFAGDTGMGPHFNQIKTRLGAPRLSLLPIGAFLPRWFMAPVHLSPEEAVEAHQILDSKVSVPIHYGTFHLGDDGEDTPLKRLRAALDARPEIKKNFWILKFGEGRSF